MACELIVTDDAHEDVDQVLGYITGALYNPAAASSLLAQIEACFDQLREFPLSFEECRTPRLRDRGYRKAVVDNFILIYRPVRSENRVYILRFLYGGRDYEKLL